MLSNRFKSGKYIGRTYLDVWKENPSYMYWMQENFEYFRKVVKALEERDRQIAANKPRVKHKFPSVEEVREFLKKNPILGFDLTDHVTSIYESCPDSEKFEYWRSLKERNKL